MISKHLSAEALELANRILGLLLPALAMETIIDASADLFHEAGNQIQEMSFLRR